MARLGPWKPKLYNGNPWHPRPFMRGETNDLPFDRDSIVLYSSYTEAVFWDESETPDNITNAKSVLETRVLNPTNTDYGDEAVASEKDVTENAKAIWLGIFPTAKLHALWKQKSERGKNIDHGAVLELHIPTEPLQCLIDAPPRSGETGVLVKNSEDFVEKVGFGSREQAVQNLRQRLKKVTKVDSNFKGEALNKNYSGDFQTAELVQFATPYQAHLENVTRVWTPTFTKGHSWVPINKYLENIQSQSANTPTFSMEKELGEEYKEHEKLRKAAENLMKAVLRENIEGTSNSAPQELFSGAKRLTAGNPDLGEKKGKKWKKEVKREIRSLSDEELETLIEEKRKRMSNNSYWGRDRYLENHVEPYVQAQYQIEEVLEEMAQEFSFFQKLRGVHDFSFGPKIRTCYEVVEHRKEIEKGSKAFYNSIVKIDEREKEKLKKKDWQNREKIREFEIEANQGLLNVASKLPDLRPLKSNLQSNPREWLFMEAKSIRSGAPSQENTKSLFKTILSR